MTNDVSPVPFELNERTYVFAKNIRSFVRKIPRNTLLLDDQRQVIRSSGSIGANYIEANDALSLRDRILRFRIARKEAKETVYWLRLIAHVLPPMSLDECRMLENEAAQLTKILSSIIQKLQTPIPSQAAADHK